MAGRNLAFSAVGRSWKLARELKLPIVVFWGALVPVVTLIAIKQELLGVGTGTVPDQGAQALRALASALLVGTAETTGLDPGVAWLTELAAQAVATLSIALVIAILWRHRQGRTWSLRGAVEQLSGNGRALTVWIFLFTALDHAEARIPDETIPQLLAGFVFTFGLWWATFFVVAAIVVDGAGPWGALRTSIRKIRGRTLSVLLADLVVLILFGAVLLVLFLLIAGALMHPGIASTGFSAGAVMIMGFTPIVLIIGVMGTVSAGLKVTLYDVGAFLEPEPPALEPGHHRAAGASPPTP